MSERREPGEHQSASEARHAERHGQRNGRASEARYAERNGRVDREAAANGPESLLAPLYDDDAERAVLGAAIVSESRLDDLISGFAANGSSPSVKGLREEHFFSETHRDIYRAIRAVRDAGGAVDRITLVDELRRTKRLDAIGGKEYVLELVEEVRSLANVHRHVEIVHRYAKMREVRQVVEEARLWTGDRAKNPDEVQAEVYARLDAIGLEPEGEGPGRAADAVSDAIAAYQAAYERGGGLAGVATGLKDLDDLLRGLKKGTMNLLAGRPGEGKTALAGNVIWHASTDEGEAVTDADGDTDGSADGSAAPDAEPEAEPEDVVLFFSLEMSREQVITRFISTLANVPVERLDTGEIMDAEWPRIMAAGARVSRRNIWVDDAQGLTVAEMHARARRTAQRLRARGQRLSLVVVDYLQLVGADRRYENRNVEVSAISRDLKNMAGKLGVPMLVLSQLSRAVMGRADKRPQLEDLRDSGSLEQDAFSVTMIFHDHDENSDHKGTAELLVRKNRNGRTGMARVAWMPTRMRFADIARAGQVPPPPATR